MDLQIVTLKEAKEKGFQYYFTGNPCKNGHISQRYVSCRGCVTCHAEFAARNEEKLKIQKRNLYLRTRDKRLEQAKTYRQENRDKILDYFQQNKEKIAETKKEWRKQNPHKNAEYCSKRKAVKLKAVPGWYDHEKVLAVRTEVLKLVEETGVEYHVDHIIPLQSDFVCGLHWHGNMQILTAAENVSKHNKWWPDMSDTSDPELLELLRKFEESSADQSVLKSEGLLAT
jgi:hypothetical protein